jgi:hypothetical protein
MTTQWSKELLREISEDPKNEILHIIKGSRAVSILSNVLFPDNLEARHEWVSRFAIRIKRRAVLVIYARTKRVNRDIIFSLITGLTRETGNVTGQSFTYKKGMKVIEEVM